MTFERISKNCYRGRPIRDINEIVELSENRKSVYFYGWSQYIKPASWIIHQQAIQVQQWINNGNLFHCIKKEDFEPIKF